MTGYDGFKRITGTKLRAAVGQNGLPTSIVVGSADCYDSTRFTDVMENIPDFPDDDSIKQITLVYAGRGHDAESIRGYPRDRNTAPCIAQRNFNARNNQAKNQLQQDTICRRGYLRGSRIFTGPEPGMKETQKII